MLAGMRLTSLAHTAAAAPPFNSTFYATVATIIPVLYLALAVQGSTYADLLKAAAKAWNSIRQRANRSGPAAGIFLPYIGSVLLGTAALQIPILGVLGEIQALIALDQQRAPGGPRIAIVTSATLAVAVAAGPALAFARFLSNLPTIVIGTAPAGPGAPSPSESPPPDATPGAPITAEPGKTRAEE